MNGAGPEYNPRWDPDYRRRVLLDLFTHWGCWRQLHKTIGGDFETVREAVERGRVLGFVIEGDHELGYRVIDYMPRPYVRSARVMGDLKS